MPSLMTQILRGSLPLTSAEKILSEILDREVYPPMFPNSIGAMTGLTLATMANRWDDMKDKPNSLFGYSVLTNLVRETELLRNNPAIHMYTKGIVYLSYYEWRDILKR